MEKSRRAKPKGVPAVNGNRQGRDQRQGQEGDKARDSFEDTRAHSVEETDVQGQQVAGVPHEQRCHKPKKQPLQAANPPVAQNQHHEEQVEQRPERVCDEFVRHSGRELGSRIH